jgi:hypothetical protein
MWGMLKTLLVQGILAKTLLRSFGWLAWLVPAGFLLKTIGLPLLAVLGVLALPVLVLLFVIGLPVFLVLIVGGALMALVGTVLTVGIALAKVIVPIALIVWLVSWLMRGKKGDPDPAPAASPTA